MVDASLTCRGFGEVTGSGERRRSLLDFTGYEASKKITGRATRPQGYGGDYLWRTAVNTQSGIFLPEGPARMEAVDLKRPFYGG